jgi:hypothetical protein
LSERQNLWLDGLWCLLAVAFAATIAIISAHVSPAYQEYLYALAGGSAVVGLVQGLRAIRSTLRHDRAIMALQAAHHYLLQPEASRQWDALIARHEALKAADQRFRDNFSVEDRKVGNPVIRCQSCDWETEEALWHARESALDHLDEAHSQTPRRRGLVPFGH